MNDSRRIQSNGHGHNPANLEKARVFAMAAHAAIGQKRKYTDEEYIVHPTAVVQLLHHNCERHPTEAMIMGAWLHDVVEDTGVSIFQIEEMFGEEVANIVRQVTKITTKEMGNRGTRKSIDLIHYANGGRGAQTVKLADIADNCKDIAERAPEFAKQYLVEQRTLAEALKNGDPKMKAYCMRIIESGERMLERYKPAVNADVPAVG